MFRKFEMTWGATQLVHLCFFAGQTRLVEGELGVHQVGAYDNELDAQQQALGEVQQSTQFTTSEIIGFLNEFGTPPWVYERMFRSRELYVFTDTEKSDLNKGEADQSNKQAIDFFLRQLEEEVQNSPTQDEPEATPPVLINTQDLKIAIQAELNRLGCSLGRPDGVIGPRSRLALEAFSREVELENGADISLFESQDFLNLLKEITGPVCLTPPQAPTPNIAGTWSVDVYCYYDQYRVNFEQLQIRRNGENRYTLFKERLINGFTNADALA